MNAYEGLVLLAIVVSCICFGFVGGLLAGVA